MTPPLMRHQVVGIESLVSKPFFTLFDPPRTGKSRQVIEAAEALWREGSITCVIVVCPAQVKFNWLDHELGEVKTYARSNVSMEEIGGRAKRWFHRNDESDRWLPYFVVSYEYLRSHVQDVCERLVGQSYLVAFDESSFLRNRTTAQWKAAVGLRYGRVKIKSAGKSMKWTNKYLGAERCIMLNGTPIANHLLDLWGQFYILDREIIKETYWQFREHHCIMGGWMRKQIVGYRDLDGAILKTNEPPKKLTQSLSPWLLCRRKEDILDLPPKTSTVIEIPLLTDTWKIYREMRNNLVVELEGCKTIDATNAAVKVMRLQQITSGFLKEMEDYPVIRWTGNEKQDWLRAWLSEQSLDDSIVIWCHFRAQIERLYAFLTEPWQTDYNIFQLHGGATDEEKQRAKRDFHPKTGRSGTFRGGDARLPGILIAQAQAGGMGLNFARANINVYLSSNFSSIIREQSEERIYSPEQVKSIEVIDVLATGPKGQQTVDHLAYYARREKAQLNTWTKEEWIKKIQGEEK